MKSVWEAGKVGLATGVFFAILGLLIAAIRYLIRKKRKKKDSRKAPLAKIAHEMEDNAQDAELVQEELQDIVAGADPYWQPRRNPVARQYVPYVPRRDNTQERGEAGLKHLSENENQTLPNDERTDLSGREGAKDIKDNSDAFGRLQEELQRGRPGAIRLQQELQRVRQEAAVYIDSPAQDTMSREELIREKEDFEADLKYLSGNQHVISKHIREWKLDNPSEELTDEVTFNVIRRLRYQSEIESYEKQIRELKQRNRGRE